jgi:hypothetical protein
MTVSHTEKNYFQECNLEAITVFWEQFISSSPPYNLFS